MKSTSCATKTAGSSITQPSTITTRHSSLNHISHAAHLYSGMFPEPLSPTCSDTIGAYSFHPIDQPPPKKQRRYCCSCTNLASFHLPDGSLDLPDRLVLEAGLESPAALVVTLESCLRPGAVRLTCSCSCTHDGYTLSDGSHIHA